MAGRSRDVPEVHDPALVLAFKSLSKRDATTRLKSLAAVVDLFGAMDATAATAVLPAWLQVYERVQLDNDRRVREALYKAFGQLLSRVPGRALQPHLRTTFPLWWLHMQDPCREVAKESRALFNSTFPTAIKRAQVLVYCHSSFFAYCSSLFQQTPQTLSDQSIYSIEESTDKWERIIACALAGIAEFIEVLSVQTAEPAAAAAAPPSVTLDAYSKLLTPAVWKLSKCRTVHIRRALYALLKSLVTHNSAGVVDASMSALAPLLLVELLDEVDRSNHPAMLDALLTFLRSFGAQAWAQLSKPAGGANLVQSAFYPRFHRLLLTGLHGNWTGVYPCLLPLLSLLPDSIMEQAPAKSGKAAGSGPGSDSPLAGFYSFFFGALWEGRQALRDAATGAAVGSFLSGSKELHALLDAYGECLLYSVKKRRTEKEPALVHALVHGHFVSTLLSPPLHFASSSVSDPSVSAEARALNTFGASFFERVGRVLRDLCAALACDSQQRADELWQEVGRVCADAVTAAASAPVPSAAEDIAPALPVAADAAVAAPSPVHKRLAAAVAVQSIDSFLAVGIVLVQAAAKGDGSSSASSAQLRCVAAVFERSLAHFVSRPSSARLSALKLCVQLADAHTLGAILSSYATSPPPSLAAFLSASLLPVLRQLLSAAGQATDSVSDAASAALYGSYMETVELFCRGLLARALDELGLGEGQGQGQAGAAPAGVWGELLQLLTASSTLSASASASLLSAKSHLSLLRILFANILCRAPTVRGHPALQDLVVDLAERMLTCERAELLGEHCAIFDSIVRAHAGGCALLEPEVLFTLLSSFLDGVVSFQKQEGDLALLACAPGKPPSSSSSAAASSPGSSLSLGFVQRFEQETGASVQAVPALVKLLGTLIAAGETPLLQALAPTPAEAESMRAQLVHSLFWLQFSARAGVARAAADAWRRVDRSMLQQQPSLLLDLASVFRQRLLTLPLSCFTSHFIVSWSAWLVQLHSSVGEPALRHALLDAALPSHEHFRRMLGGMAPSASSDADADADCGTPSLHDVAERLRVIRDLVSELLSSAHADAINERVLFLGEASPSPSGGAPDAWQGSPRLGLLLDLLAVQRFLRCFEREADAAAMPSDDEAGVAVAAPADSDEAALHPSVQQRLQGYVASSFLSSAHLLALIQAALDESRSPLKDVAVAPAAALQAATDCARSYTSALGWLLSLAQDTLFDDDDEEQQDADAQAARAAVHATLVSFLSAVPMASLRPQDHSALFTPLESTLVVVLESGCLCARGGSSATDALLVQLMRGVLAGLEAGMRTLSKQNSRLFALSSPLNLLAALLRAAYAAINADGGTSEELQSCFASTRTKLVALAPNFNLFEPLAPGAGGFGTEVCRFMEARSTLVHALIECAEGELDDGEEGGADAAAALENAVTPALLQSAVLWSASVLRFATNQHAAAIRRSRELLAQKGRDSTSSSSSAASSPASAPPSDVSAAWSFAYLPATLALMAHLMPLVLSSSSTSLVSALHVFMGAAYPLLVGGGGGSGGSGGSSAHGNLLLSVLSVKCFTRLSVDLEQLFRCYREQRTDKLMELVREGMRDRTAEGGSDSAELRALFLLLSHPFPSVSLAALHCLSVGLLERAIATPVSFEVDEAEEMRHVLAASAKQSAKAQRRRVKDAQSSPDSADGEGGDAAAADEADVALEHYRKTLRNSYRSAQTQKRVDQLLPRTLQRILEERVRLNEVDVIEEDEDEEAGEDDREDAPFFSFRPVALQLRGHLLTWSLVLDLLSQSLPAPAGPASSSSAAGADASAAPVQVSLSSEKSALLVSFLREGDCVAPFASELVEHVLVGLTESQTEELVLGAVARYEHRVQSGETEGEDASSPAPAPAPASVPAPAVEIEDEDEDGNVRPAAAAKPAAAAAAVVAEDVAEAPESVRREFPLWLSPCMLLPSEARHDIKVLPFLMKRLLKIRKSEQQDGQHGGATAAAAAASLTVVDPCIFYGHMSALLYLRTLRVLPALSRSWFSHMDRSNGAVVSKMTAASFSALLIQDELLDVDQRQAAELRAHPQDEEEQFVISTNYEPTQWRAGSSAGRRAAAVASAAPAVVSAKFRRGEISMGLSLKLPPCYPLLPVSASLTDAVKLKEERSKKWLLSITSILGSSDGSVYSAVQAWHANLLQHFAGVEECTICYSVVSATNHALPRMKCNECGNKFHSTCLYKWFQSSGNSRCPLCRTLFSA